MMLEDGAGITARAQLRHWSRGRDGKGEGGEAGIQWRLGGVD